MKKTNFFNYTPSCHGAQSARVYIFCCIVFASCMLIMAPARAAAVTSRELIDKAKEYDGSVVLYEGEAIGEVMMRGDFAWVNVRDSRNAIGIWVPSTVTRTIKSLGSYQRRGDRVLVTGIFHRACRIHGGDLDIHATALSLQEPGSRIPAPLDLGKIRLMINLTIILFLVIIGAMLVRIRLSRKQ